MPYFYMNMLARLIRLLTLVNSEQEVNNVMFPCQSLLQETVYDTIPKMSTTLNFTIDAFFNTLGAFFYNSSAYSDKSNLYLFYNLTFTGTLNIKNKVIINSRFYNELGYKIYFDTINNLSSDLYSFNNSILFPIKGSNWNISMQINHNSQFWSHYDYRDLQERYLYSSYLSPGYTVFAGGVSYNFWKQSSISVSLAGAQKTKIKNQSLFDQRQQDILYGIEKGNKVKYDFGFHISIMLFQEKIFKNLYTDLAGEVFIKPHTIKDTKIQMHNVFHYLFFRYLRLSLQTDFQYDMNSYGVVTQLMLGVYFNNKM